MTAKRRHTPGALLGLALLMLSPPSSAQAQAQAAPAEALFEEGRALLAEKRFSEACAKFAASERLDPAVGTLLNLGDCYEKMGKTATAWAVFKQAVSMAHGGKQASREKLAVARAEALEPNLPRLAITVKRPIPGVEVRRDGLVLGEAEWSGPVASAVPLDPGEHEISVIAPGKKAWSAKVELAADGQTRTVEVPELETDELAERAPLKPASQATLSIEAVNTHDRNVQRGIGIAVAAVGLVTLAVGVPFGARAITLNKTAEGECPTNDTCSRQGHTDAQSAVTSALLSTVLILAGAGVAVGGAVVFATAPTPKHEAPLKGLRLAPALGQGALGLRLSGSF